MSHGGGGIRLPPPQQTTPSFISSFISKRLPLLLSSAYISGQEVLHMCFGCLTRTPKLDFVFVCKIVTSFLFTVRTLISSQDLPQSVEK